MDMSWNLDWFIVYPLTAYFLKLDDRYFSIVQIAFGYSTVYYYLVFKPIKPSNILISCITVSALIPANLNTITRKTNAINITFQYVLNSVPSD